MSHWLKLLIHSVKFKVAALYLLFGVTWILLSDRILAWFVRDAHALTIAQSYKGIAYVLITTALLFVIIGRFLARAARAEGALNRGEHRLMSIVDQAGAIVFIKDREGRHLVANLRLREMLDLPMNAIIHRTAREIFSGSADQIERNDRIVFESGAAQSFEEFVDAPGGRRFFHVTKIPIFDDDGIVRSLCGLAVDITAQRLAEEELHRTRAFLDRLVKALPSFLYIYDLNAGVFPYANEGIERVVGYTPEELTEMGDAALATVIHPDDLDARREDLRRFAESPDEKARTREYRMRHKDGGDVWVADDAGVFQRGDDGRVTLIAGSVTDISERMRSSEARTHLEQQLAESQKLEAVGRLAGGVAHDFNNLLTAILGYTDFIIAGLGENDPMLDDAREVRASAERAASLTQQLLAFSRRQIVSPRTVGVNGMLNNSRKMFARVIGEDIELRYDFDPHDPRVRIDPHQFDQVLMNLVVNARDAMPDGGTLIFETSTVVLDEAFCRGRENLTPGNFVALAVSDSGAGMDAETRARIFEPFFTTKPRGKGTGLGLATVYGIVRQNNGAITVYTEPGMGTTFRIYLPAIEGETDARAPAGTEVVESGSETILLVEDEDLVRRFARRSLTSAGYNLVDAADGEKAIETFRNLGGAVDLLVTDVVMPKLNGAELYEKLRATSPKLRVLYISGYTEDAIVHHGVLEGGVNFLQKPFTARQIARCVRAALDAPAPESTIV